MRRKGSCLVCKTRKQIRGRGLCDACYEAARRSVNAGTATWAELEKKKLALKPFASKFREALAKLRG